jgi:hypothetical protein
MLTTPASERNSIYEVLVCLPTAPGLPLYKAETSVRLRFLGGLGVIGPEKFAQYFTGHPAAAQAYAWSSPMEGSNKRRFFAVFASATNYVARRSRKGGVRRAT